MQNEIKIFNNPEFGEIRTVMIEGEPWFVGKDVCRALGYVDTYSGVRKNVDREDKRGCPVGSTSGTQETTVINESGLYSLIFASKLESAKKFKKWVTSEVLPSIRKTGAYGRAQLPQTTDGKIALLAQGHTELKEEIESVRQELDDFKRDMPLLAVECDRITTAVHRRGVDALGGKESNAYKDVSLRGKVYRDIHRGLKRQFGVSTYKAIKRSQCEIAVSIITEYELPIVLQEQIENCNAQISMEVE